ncbi:4Fe-4S binding protein [candidate division WOR-3 bacterium]|nr:4Fe-4S binding protein [candidate division WOR-3 bacterium]
MKIAVSSGKGGVGKSMLASSLAILFSKNHQTVAVDCDVDAPNLAIWLNEDKDWYKIKEISTSEKPVIDYKKCIGCGICVKNCQFGALKLKRERPVIDKFICEGCGVCEILCPQKAIKLKPVKNGEIRIKKTRYGFPLVSSQLYPGETGSGKIVDEVKKLPKNIRVK